MAVLSASAHFHAFLRDPKGVAAIVPTSKFTTQRIAAKVVPDRAELIVEYGPGSGVLTRALLDRLQPDGRLVAIETNADFATQLPEQIDDGRLTVVHDSAERVSEILEGLGLDGVDYAFSGIPLFWLTPDTARRIVVRTREVLAKGGRFVNYQTFYLPRQQLAVHLEAVFDEVRSELDLRNLPPYRIYEAVKGG